MNPPPSFEFSCLLVMAAAAASDFVGRIVVSSSRTCNCFGRIESATASGASVRIRRLHKNRASTTPGVPTLDYIVTPDTDGSSSESVFTVRYHPAGTAYYRSPVSFGSETTAHGRWVLWDREQVYVDHEE